MEIKNLEYVGALGIMHGKCYPKIFSECYVELEKILIPSL